MENKIRKNLNRRKLIIIQRQEQIKREKRIILFASILILFITISIFVTIGYNKYGKDIYASAKINQIKDNESDEIDDLLNNHNKQDNSGYLCLADDPNAEDAMKVFKNTEGLLKGEKQYPVRKDGKKVAYITFDDGPSTENTQNILNVLDEYDVKATFFVTGSAIEDNEQTKKLLKEEVARGHAIGNHTYSHDYGKLYPGNRINAENFMNEIQKTNKILKEVLGNDFETRVIRFPGGYWSWDGRSKVRPLIDEKGYAIIDWNALSKDSEGKIKNASELLQCVKETTNNLGSDADSVVILMHDTYGKRETVKALPNIIQYLENKGFEFKTIK